MSDGLKDYVLAQRDDTAKVIVALVKGFVVAVVAYFVSVGLAMIIRNFGGTAAAEALEFFDGYVAALTYVAVAGKDLIELTFK